MRPKHITREIIRRLCPDEVLADTAHRQWPGSSGDAGGLRMACAGAIVQVNLRLDPCWHFGEDTPKARAPFVAVVTVGATRLEDIWEASTDALPDRVVWAIYAALQPWRRHAEVSEIRGALIDKMFRGEIGDGGARWLAELDAELEALERKTIGPALDLYEERVRG